MSTTLDPHTPTVPAPTMPETVAMPDAPAGVMQRLKAPRSAPGRSCSGSPPSRIVLDRWPEYIGDPTRIRQWAEYLCYAMIAVGISIAWGRGGMLTLGQGVFFGLGAYSMGMYLSLEQVPDGAMPEFMSLYSDYRTLPWLWQPFKHLWFAAPVAVLVPMLVAAGLGWLVFNRRIRGAYFAILTQATALVFWLLVVGQLQLTAGTNGLTNFSTVFGRSKYAPGTNEFLFGLAAVGLFVTLRDRASGGEEPLRPAARRHPRRRRPRALPRLRPRGHQDVRVRGVGGHGRPRRRARARRSSASSHRTSSRCCRRSSWSRGSRSADARRSTARSSARCS